GGMGEVYRAYDTRLKREIALKVLPEAFSRDSERMTRFEREAQVLAALNHPNIASIYGLQDAPNGIFALMMELVPGPTLGERIGTKPIPLRDALVMARQIAEALEYAHEHGIVHCDLKPANVKITDDGTVKILDFGLAKAVEEDTNPADVFESPTISIPVTHAGMIVGTAAYMSPEQARGKTLDRRTDIWSFGCVLYESLTGRQAFPGDTATDIVAAILGREPDWNALPSGVPTSIRKLLERCLRKDLKQRLHEIADARIEIEDTLREPVEHGKPENTARAAPEKWRFRTVAPACVLAGV